VYLAALLQMKIYIIYFATAAVKIILFKCPIHED